MNKEEEKKSSSASQQKSEEDSSNELKDEDLSQVSGGMSVCSICGVPVPCACIP